MKELDFNLIGALAQAAADAYRVATINSQATDTQILIKEMVNGAVAVAFRGTDDFSKWVGDAEVALARPNDLPPGEGKWHYGVCKAVINTRAQLVAVLRKLPEKTPIYFTGHSFGGGCAPASAYLLSLLGFSVAGVVTFAGMRFGDKVFQARYDEILGDRTFRVVAKYDVVPHLPIPGLLLTYRHIGEEVYFSTDEDGVSDAQVMVGRPVTQMLWQDGVSIFRAWRIARAMQFLRLPVEVAGMHSMNRYQKLVAEQVARSPSPQTSPTGEGNAVLRAGLFGGGPNSGPTIPTAN